MIAHVDEITTILKNYNVKVNYIEELSQKAVKVYTDSGTFVLKRLVRKQQNFLFIDAYTLLRKHGLTSFVPLVKNQHKQYLSYYNGMYYYLMPWLPNELDRERDERHIYLFKELALLHKRTEKEIKLSGQETKTHYETMIKQWEEAKRYYEVFVNQSEQRLYLSPFELQAYTYFIEVSRAIDFSCQKLKEWSEVMSDAKETRIVLNHGKISSQHFLYDEEGKGHLINFEEAKYAAPIDDLLLFMVKTARTNPVECDECVNWFYTYQKGYPYTEAEMHLFLSYLAFPNRLCQIIQSYVKRNKNQSELDLNRQLTKAYWQFKNIEYVVMKISEIEERKKLEAETTSS